jgi:hypothetical protein
MSLVGFEPPIPAFERVKTVHALGRASTVIGWFNYLVHKVYDDDENRKLTFLCGIKIEEIS